MGKSDIRLLEDRVGVIVDEALKVSRGGITLVGSAQEKSKTGKVVAVGPDVKGVDVGDSVIFELHTGIDVELDGKKLYVFKVENIIGVI